jgi:hypothetical protein
MIKDLDICVNSFAEAIWTNRESDYLIEGVIDEFDDDYN